MVAATSEGLERVSAERRARWLRQRRRRRVFWLVVAVAALAATGAVLWPRGGTSMAARLAAQSAAPTRRMPVRPLPGQPNLLLGLRAALPATEGVTHGTPAKRMVALTFDDGPSGRTPAILRVLANHHVHATFFVVGRSTRGMEPVLRHIAATGNELADHTYSHADLLALREPAQRRQLEWTRGLVALFHRFGLKTFAWDTQETRYILAALRQGVDGIYCDRVDRMVATVGEWSG